MLLMTNWGVAAVAFPLAVEGDDVLVVVDRTLRPDAANHAKGFHFVELGFLINQYLLRSTS